MPKKTPRTPVPTSTVKARIQLRRAITRYANAQEKYAFRGAGHPEDIEDAEHTWEEAPERLMHAIDVFEATTRADAVNIALAEPEPTPLPENVCRYCNGNMHHFSETDLGPCNCAPKTGEVWLHKNGKLYVVMGLTNTHNLRADHPIDVVYRNHSLDAGSTPTTVLWSRRLTDWSRSFVRVPAGRRP
jgi:hypothetical protein